MIYYFLKITFKVIILLLLWFEFKAGIEKTTTNQSQPLAQATVHHAPMAALHHLSL